MAVELSQHKFDPFQHGEPVPSGTAVDVSQVSNVRDVTSEKIYVDLSQTELFKVLIEQMQASPRTLPEAVAQNKLTPEQEKIFFSHTTITDQATKKEIKTWREEQMVLLAEFIKHDVSFWEIKRVFKYTADEAKRLRRSYNSQKEYFNVLKLAGIEHLSKSSPEYKQTKKLMTEINHSHLNDLEMIISPTHKQLQEYSNNPFAFYAYAKRFYSVALTSLEAGIPARELIRPLLMDSLLKIKLYKTIKKYEKQRLNNKQQGKQNSDATSVPQENAPKRQYLAIISAFASNILHMLSK